MKRSEQINEIAAALAKAQGEINNAILNKTNPHFKNRYADLAAVRDAVNGSLSKHGIAHTQILGEENDRMVLYTTLLHASGQWLMSEFHLNGSIVKPQDIGSALTYARRYSLSAICGIASEEDDDGNAAQDGARGSRETTGLQGTYKASKAKNREPFLKLVGEMNATKTLDALKAWLKNNAANVKALPEDWVIHFSEEYDKHKAWLADNGGTVAPRADALNALLDRAMIDDWIGRLRTADRDSQEELFLQEIEPAREAGQIPAKEYNELVALIKEMG